MIRPDMSDWIIHFVHNYEESLDWLFSDEERPFRYSNGKAQQIEWPWSQSEEEWRLGGAERSAFEVLEKILRDGFLRASWSIRNNQPTVYGESPAVCFTEMPLSSLMLYARQRNDESKVSTYAIAIKKSEAFLHGARPVIYGTTTPHQEMPRLSENLPRLLDPSCGIGIGEQYRYVYTSLKTAKTVDWTHEREWRWAHVPGIGCPGFSLWIEPWPSLSEIFILVKTDEEVSTSWRIIRQLVDKGTTEYDVPYAVEFLKQVKIASVEGLSKLDAEAFRIEDIPNGLKSTLTRPKVSMEDLEQAKQLFEEVHEMVTNSTREVCHDSGVCGFNYLMMSKTENPVCEAFLQLGYAEPHRDDYSLDISFFHWYSNVDAGNEVAFEMADFLNRKLNVEAFWARRVLD